MTKHELTVTVTNERTNERITNHKTMHRHFRTDRSTSTAFSTETRTLAISSSRAPTPRGGREELEAETASGFPRRRRRWWRRWGREELGGRRVVWATGRRSERRRCRCCWIGVSRRRCRRGRGSLSAGVSPVHSYCSAGMMLLMQHSLCYCCLWW